MHPTGLSSDSSCRTFYLAYRIVAANWFVRIVISMMFNTTRRTNPFANRKILHSFVLKTTSTAQLWWCKPLTWLDHGTVMKQKCRHYDTDPYTIDCEHNAKKHLRFLSSCLLHLHVVVELSFKFLHFLVHLLHLLLWLSPLSVDGVDTPTYDEHPDDYCRCDFRRLDPP